MTNLNSKWQIIKTLVDDNSISYRCERKREDMNIIDSMTFKNLADASLRCKELNNILRRATQSLSEDAIDTYRKLAKLHGIDNLWCVTTLSVFDSERYVCYRLGEKSGNGRVKAMFDGLLFTDRYKASARCRELNAPLLPKVAPSQFSYDTVRECNC